MSNLESMQTRCFNKVQSRWISNVHPYENSVLMTNSLLEKNIKITISETLFLIYASDSLVLRQKHPLFYGEREYLLLGDPWRILIVVDLGYLGFHIILCLLLLCKINCQVAESLFCHNASNRLPSHALDKGGYWDKRFIVVVEAKDYQLCLLSKRV